MSLYQKEKNTTPPKNGRIGSLVLADVWCLLLYLSNHSTTLGQKTIACRLLCFFTVTVVGHPNNVEIEMITRLAEEQKIVVFWL